MSNLFQIKNPLKSIILQKQILPLLKLLRWNKPSGRLILLIPAGWSLWLTPTAPPSIELFGLIVAGTVFISGAGCIANDLWDKDFDRQVNRTKTRPLSAGIVKISTAFGLLIIMMIFSLLTVLLLPALSRILCLQLSIISLPLIILYPSAKRWFKYPQAILSLCWGFSVLIPWAASQSNINLNVPMVSCWIATMVWTFGFDTVYAMTDKNDDESLGLNSSALSLQGKVITPVSISYALTSLFLALGAYFAEVSFLFWPFWAIASLGMQREVWTLQGLSNTSKKYGQHFGNQVRLGGLILLGLVISRI